MNIAFTGHRNKQVNTSELLSLITNYPNATWIHGGAKGFDTQIAEFATHHSIKQIIIKPDYSQGRAAPLIRNREIVNRADILIACYDGRESGGTFYTINYAHKTRKPVHILSPI